MSQLHRSVQLSGNGISILPNKEAIVSALRTRYVNEIEEQWTKLEEASAGVPVRERTQSFIEVMIRFMEDHPSYVTILDASADSKRDKKTRDRLRERLANVFRARRPGVSQEQAYRVASVSLQVIKSMNALYAEAKPLERREIAEEYKLALAAHLEKRLTS
jgi:AcrR family transcriptional regulator